jgi:Bacterial Ig-like domain (group 3)/FG-GAP-like repeat/IPT/TIG domain
LSADFNRIFGRAGWYTVSIFLMVTGTLALAQNPVPLVNQPLVPDAVAPGGPSFTLTVNGTGFVSGATVNWNGSPLATTLVNQSQLTAIVPALNIASAGTALVTVTNTSPGGGLSNGQYVSITTPTTAIAFASAMNYSSGGFSPGAVVIADVNRDGILDLLVANQGGGSSGHGTVGVLLGKGDGTFRSVVTYDSGGTSGLDCQNYEPCAPIAALAVADVNGDGKPDIVVANRGGTNNGEGLVGVLLGNGDGTFQPVVTYNSGGITASSAALADVNGDGKLDILVANQCAASDCPDVSTEGSVGVLMGNGDGTFQPVVAYDAGNGTTAVAAVADMNGDGKLDLVVVNACVINPPFCEGGGGVGVMLGNGDGTFQPAVSQYTAGSFTYDGLVADMNEDTKSDVLVANELGSYLSSDASAAVLLGNGDGTLQSPVEYDPGGQGGWSVAVGDVNGDGKPDLIMTFDCIPGSPGCQAAWTSVFLGNGNGTFLTPILVPLGAKQLAKSVALADLNGDGRLDMVVSICADAQCTQGAVAVLMNIGPTATTLMSSPNPSVIGQSVTFTAAVTSHAKGVPTGTVKFLDETTNDTTLGSVPLNGSGIAVLTLSSLASVNDFINAVYSGDKNFAPSTSPDVQQFVEDFDLVANAPATQTVTSGQAANYSGTLSPAAFTHTVSLACSGAPIDSTCSVTPNSVTFDGGQPVTVNVVVITHAAGMGLTEPTIDPFGSGGGDRVAWTSVLGLLLFSGWYSQPWFLRPKWRYTWALPWLLAVGISMPACGGGSSGGGGGGGGTPKGTYTLTVTGTFNSSGVTLSHSAAFTLIVD